MAEVSRPDESSRDAEPSWSAFLFAQRGPGLLRPTASAAVGGEHAYYQRRPLARWELGANGTLPAPTVTCYPNNPNPALAASPSSASGLLSVAQHELGKAHIAQGEEMRVSGGIGGLLSEARLAPLTEHWLRPMRLHPDSALAKEGAAQFFEHAAEAGMKRWCVGAGSVPRGAHDCD